MAPPSLLPSRTCEELHPLSALEGRLSFVCGLLCSRRVEALLLVAADEEQVERVQQPVIITIAGYD